MLLVLPLCDRTLSAALRAEHISFKTMSANGQVIKAAQMFIKQGAGASKGVNLKAEMLYGLTLGMGAGLTWKVRT